MALYVKPLQLSNRRHTNHGTVSNRLGHDPQPCYASFFSVYTCIWNTGAIGLAVAFDRFEIAVVLAIINVVSLLLFGKRKEEMEPGHTENQ